MAFVDISTYFVNTVNFVNDFHNEAIQLEVMLELFERGGAHRSVRGGEQCQIGA